MIALGLSAADLRLFQSTLLANHPIKVTVAVTNLNGTVIADISSYVIDGQVDFTTDGDVSRSASLTLLDPDLSLSFDSSSPVDTAFYLDRMISIRYGVGLPDGRWVTVPLFLGPVVGFSRNADIVTVKADGKETLALNACWYPLVLAKGMRTTDAIRSILVDRAGENQLAIPAMTNRLPAAISLTRESIPWAVAKSLARGLNRQLFYDGRGIATLRPFPTTSVYTFTKEGVTTPLQVALGSTPINTVWVQGSGSANYAISAPAGHPLNPWALGRNGRPRILLSVINVDSVSTVAAAKVAATAALNDALRQGVTASFDSIPVPHLEESDPVTVTTDQATVAFRMATFSIPLSTGSSSAMAVGYNRNLSLAAYRRRNK